MKTRNFRTIPGATMLALLSMAFLVSCASSPPASSPAASSPPASPSPASPQPPPPETSPAAAVSSSPEIVGEWGIQIKFFEHPIDGTLRFTREGRALLGSFTDDEGNQSELEKLHVAEGKISWEMDRKDGRLSVKGTIDGTIMSGKMKLHRPRDEDAGFGGGGAPPAGYARRAGESDTFTFTAVKRARTTPAPAPPPPQ